MRLSLADIAHATEGRIDGVAGDAIVTAVSTDTRTIGPGQLFVAIRGDRFDGHAFVRGAEQAGAVAALVDERPADATGPCVIVADTVQALGRLAAAQRARFTGPVVAITGSNGKTTTKEMCAAILSEAGVAVRRTPGNLNNHIGLPLSILALEDHDRALVVELGMNHPGEIDTLARIARPTIGAITQVAAAHLGPVGSLDAIARAKGELLEHIQSTGHAVLNGDDPNVMAQRSRSSAQCILFGFGADAHYRAVGDPKDLDRGSFRLEGPELVVELRLPLPGRHLILDALCAVACAHTTGLLGSSPAPPIQRALEAFRGLAGRLSLRTFADGLRVLDDSYNANPDSVRAALATLRGLQGSSQSFAVLGDMLELGPDAERLHADTGRAAAEAGVSALLGVGPLAEHAVVAARAAGLARAESFAEPSAAAHRIREWARPGDIVLIKGSRGSRMERVTAELESK